MTDRLTDTLRTRSARQFETQTAMANALSRVAAERGMKLGEVLEGLVCSLVSVVQARAPENEWADVGQKLAEEVQRRLTVTGVT